MKMVLAIFLNECQKNGHLWDLDGETYKWRKTWCYITFLKRKPENLLSLGLQNKPSNNALN